MKERKQIVQQHCGVGMKFATCPGIMQAYWSEDMSWDGVLLGASSGCQCFVGSGACHRASKARKKKKNRTAQAKAERRDGEPHGAMRGEQLFDFVYSPWPRLVIVNFTSHQICINAMNAMLMDKSYVSKVQAAPWQTLNFRVTLGSKVANKQQAASDHYVTVR